MLARIRVPQKARPPEVWRISVRFCTVASTARPCALRAGGPIAITPPASLATTVPLGPRCARPSVRVRPVGRASSAIVCNFYRRELHGWKVRGSEKIAWGLVPLTPDAGRYVPEMRTPSPTPRTRRGS
jgi:hypothetical protein